MKSSKSSSTFLPKFSSLLSKFKQSSTISVAHEQLRKLFSQYPYSEIWPTFCSKMDSCEQLNEKQKRELVKVYITVMDIYGQDVILEGYDRFVESVAKKSGVDGVIGHLCRTLLKRIYPSENIANYVRHLLGVFQKNAEIGKIIKQIVEGFDPQIIAPFQGEILALIVEKMGQNQKNQMKIQLLEAILAIILALQSKFYQQSTVQNIVIKNFKSDDWTIRKLCVDITYALFVINSQVNKSLHDNVLQMKYDKIKHVRDSVGNYTNLYKQIYGQQKQKIPQKPIPHRISNIQPKRPLPNKSPAVLAKFKPTQQQSKSNPKSLQKSIKNTARNQQFFQNAGSNDIIKMPQSKSFVSLEHREPHREKTFSENMAYNDNQQQYQVKRQQKIQSNPQINFQNYLKNRPKQDNFINLSPKQKQPQAHKQKQKQKRIQTNYNPLQKHRAHAPTSPRNQLRKQAFREELSGRNRNQVGKKNQDHYLVDSKYTQQRQRERQSVDTSFEMGNLLRKQLQLIQLKFQKFSIEVISKLTNLQRRVQSLQNKRLHQSLIDQVSIASLQKDIKQLQNPINASIQQSFNQKYSSFSPSPLPLPEINVNQSSSQFSQNQNVDEAFSLALANSNPQQLFTLLESGKVPQQKLVQDCLFAQLRRNLSNFIVLKWFTNFLQKIQLEKEKLIKLQKDLSNCQYEYQHDRRKEADGKQSKQNEERNYKMLKRILLNQIKQKIQKIQKKGNGLYDAKESMFKF